MPKGESAMSSLGCMSSLVCVPLLVVRSGVGGEKEELWRCSVRE